MNFRDQDSGRKGKKNYDDMDSDDDENNDNPILNKADDEEGKDDDRFLSPDDIKRQGELEEGVRKIRVRKLPASQTAISLQILTSGKAQTSAFSGSLR